MADNPRIEDLRRRIQLDPASIAFAQLAEEHRRAGDLFEALRVCRAGLDRHPAYLSARVTMGRTLLELGRLEEAETEFALVLESAPDNVVARRALADIHERRHAAAPTRPQDARRQTGEPAGAETTPHDPVLSELEAWLSVITERRLTRYR